MIFLGAALLCAAFQAGAQSFQEGFLLSSYRLGYRYNPAMGNDSDMISVGQFGMNTRANVGAAAFLYPRDGEVVTGLHRSVSGAELLGNLQKDNYLTSSLNYNLLSYGIARGSAYHTFELNARAFGGASVPIEIVELVKMGTTRSSFDMSDLRVQGNVYGELAYGYSRRLSDALAVGARAKLLVGLYAADMRATRLDVNTDSEALRAHLQAQLDLTSRSGGIETDEDGFMNYRRWLARDKWRLPSGVGLAFDMGVLVTPVEGLDISASVLDLGGLLWYYGNAGSLDNELSFEGLGQVTLDDANRSGLTGILTNLRNDALADVKFSKVKDNVRMAVVPFQVHAGVKYRMPFYDALSVGVTGQLLGGHGMPYKEVRAGVALRPWNWLDVTANYGVGSYGTVFGVAGSVRVLRFRATFGLQNGFGGTIPYTSTPLQANFKTVTVGVTYDL